MAGLRDLALALMTAARHRIAVLGLSLAILGSATGCTHGDDDFQDLGEWTGREDFYEKYAEYTPEQEARIAERKATFEAFVAELPFEPIDYTAYFTETMAGDIIYSYQEPDDDDGSEALLADALAMTKAIEDKGYKAELYACEPSRRPGLLPRIAIQFRSPPGTEEHMITLGWNDWFYDTAVTQVWFADGRLIPTQDPLSSRADCFPNES